MKTAVPRSLTPEFSSTAVHTANEYNDGDDSHTNNGDRGNNQLDAQYENSLENRYLYSGEHC